MHPSQAPTAAMTGTAWLARSRERTFAGAFALGFQGLGLGFMVRGLGLGFMVRGLGLGFRV